MFYDFTLLSESETLQLLLRQLRRHGRINDKRLFNKKIETLSKICVRNNALLLMSFVSEIKANVRKGRNPL